MFGDYFGATHFAETYFPPGVDFTPVVGTADFFHDVRGADDVILEGQELDHELRGADDVILIGQDDVDLPGAAHRTLEGH